MNTLDNLRRFYTLRSGVRIPLGIQRPVVGAVSREHMALEVVMSCSSPSGVWSLEKPLGNSSP
jgi:hypothetical protein